MNETTQTFKIEGTIKADLIRINSRGAVRYDWLIADEKNACDSCLICNHYKYNHDNIKKNGNKFVHICLIKAPNFIDITGNLSYALNTCCNEGFSRRALG